MTATFGTARNNPARLLRAFAIVAVIALVVSIGMVAAGVHYVQYASVPRAAALRRRRVADVTAPPARAFGSRAASGGRSARTASGRQRRRDRRSLRRAQRTTF